MSKRFGRNQRRAAQAAKQAAAAAKADATNTIAQLQRLVGQLEKEVAKQLRRANPPSCLNDPLLNNALRHMMVQHASNAFRECVAKTERILLEALRKEYLDTLGRHLTLDTWRDENLREQVFRIHVPAMGGIFVLTQHSIDALRDLADLDRRPIGSGNPEIPREHEPALVFEEAYFTPNRITEHPGLPPHG